MKKVLILLSLILSSIIVFAQAPEKMSYQAVVRDAGSNLVINQLVGMQISILQGSLSGTAVYVETQTPMTNGNGLVSMEIGSGSIVSGDFTNIDWARGPYFIKTEIDPEGGTSYIITGISQLLSVPYALHAKTAESIKKIGKNKLPLNIYGAFLDGGASFVAGFGRNAGIHLDTTSAQSFAMNFMVPEDYQKGDTLFIRMIVSGSDTGNVPVFPNFISVVNLEDGFIQGGGASTGLEFNSPVVVSTPDIPMAVSGFIVSPDGATDIEAGDEISFGYFRFGNNPGDLNPGKLRIHAVYIEY